MIVVAIHSNTLLSLISVLMFQTHESKRLNVGCVDVT